MGIFKKKKKGDEEPQTLQDEAARVYESDDEQIHGRRGPSREAFAKDAFAGMKYLPPTSLTASGLLCGPLLRYCGTYYKGDSATWRGTILLVLVTGVGKPKCDVAGKELAATNIFEENGRVFWRFGVEVELDDQEKQVDYTIRWDDDKATGSWWVQGKDDTMRILFHSCNGFSVGTDVEAYAGPALWNDVLRIHEKTPFHVMLGGGDQIYSDEVRVTGPLTEWAHMKNPEKRRKAIFTSEMEKDCDNWYFKNYCEWYSHGPFSRANRMIPQVNIWDDHDIIDGYGSYADHFMSCSFFNGIGIVAWRYYMLFQHHTAPTDPESETLAGGEEDEPSWVISPLKGRYIKQRPHNVMVRLGREILFFGIDARTERTRKMINSPETYNLMFEKLGQEVQNNKEIKHVILLLGVPIAYPRLVWLENIFTSKLMGVLRFLNSRFGVLAGSFFNNFDGAMDLLDDLDDHYCARQHKAERNELILRLQQFGARHNTRVTILSGDVHLAAVGRFHSNPKYRIPVENDHRYIANVISSAITNKPPPPLIAKILAKRNITHRFHRHTREKLFPLFNVNANGGSQVNKGVTMPHRNYCIITSTTPSSHAPSVPQAVIFPPVNEIGAGTEHFVVGGKEGVDLGPGGLEIKICVEKKVGNREGETTKYGFTIPKLDVPEEGEKSSNKFGQPITVDGRLFAKERY